MAQPQTLRGIFSGKNVVLPAWMPMLYVAAAAVLGVLLIGSALFSNDNSPTQQPTITTDPYLDGRAPSDQGVLDSTGRAAEVPEAVLAAARQSVGDARLVLLEGDGTRYVFRAVTATENGPAIKTIAVVSVDGAYVVEAATPAPLS